MDSEKYEELVRIYGLEIGILACAIVGLCFACKFFNCCCNNNK